ncbi:MAG: hypothetical protein HY290_19545 [Planctomycetia bacterium]|nr:hypothetical protein [Planctomycetia bacterium]
MGDRVEIAEREGEAAAMRGNGERCEIRPARPVAAPAAEVARPNGDGQVGKGASPDRILGVEELPWADSPSSRLNPLSMLLDRPNNPNQLLRSMKSMQSRK